MNLENFLDKAYHGTSLRDLPDQPVAALKGVSEEDGELLLKAFHVKTIRDLAQLKYVAWAQAIVTLAEGEKAG